LDFESELKCYNCNSQESTLFMTAVDDYTGRPGSYSYVKCSDCSIVYQSPRLCMSDVRGFYDDAYLSHQKKLDFGLLTPAVNWALSGHDRRKAQLITRNIRLNADSRVLDVGCARATFLKHIRDRFGAAVSGVDFKDMRQVTDFENIDFRHGLFYDQDFGTKTFDVITMWHFLEHCYDPARSLATARELLAANGIVVIEVPDLDSISFKLFGKHWPGVQAPQHTVLFDRQSLRSLIEKSGLAIIETLPWGSFPPFFYFYMGTAFKLNKGRGFDVRRHLPSYFATQALSWPIFTALSKRNLAMQAVICKRA